jgi:PPOX class probable F420-dependent enzyme
MDVTPEQTEYLSSHQWAVLATGRKDGSPQVSMVGYSWNGEAIVVTFRQGSAKRHNMARQSRVALLVPDGRRALTVYGDATLLEEDPERIEAFAAMMARYGAPEQPAETLAEQLDREGRVCARIQPTALDLHD